MPCCSCNGQNAVCKRCVCARSGTPCINCLPLKAKNCGNTLLSHVDSVSDLSDTSVERVIRNGGARGNHVSSTAIDFRFDLCRYSSVNNNDASCNVSLLPDESQILFNSSHVTELMI